MLVVNAPTVGTGAVNLGDRAVQYRYECRES
jgi:hypothetical protein